MLLVSFARFMFRGSLQRQLYAPIYKVATKWVENTNSYASGFSGCNVASGRFLSLFLWVPTLTALNFQPGCDTAGTVFESK